jgi:subtilisin family serine protease
MNRRPLILFTLLLAAGFVVAGLEITGQLGLRSVTGRATGGGDLGGCAGPMSMPAPENVYTCGSVGDGEGGYSCSMPGADLQEGQWVAKLRTGSLAAADSVDEASAPIRLADLLNEAKLPTHRPALELPEDAGSERVGQSHALSGLVRFQAADALLHDAVNQVADLEWFEPVIEVRAASIMPSDPLWPLQWSLNTLGVAEAWSVSRGQGVVVAVLDTGVRAGEDGFANLLPGYDMVANDTDPTDESHHGSHVAGIIAQGTDNEIGTAGIAPEASILPVRVLDQNGVGNSIDVARGILWAVDHGAHIINMSFETRAYSEVIAAACDYAHDRGVLLVAAAGNNAYVNGVAYPAALPSVLSVGATDMNHEVARYSNRGAHLDLVAPGGDLKVDLDEDGHVDGVLQEAREGDVVGYYLMEGTSVAAAHVSGVAALVRATGITDVEELRAALIHSAEDLMDEGWDSVTGYGMVDAAAAVEGPSNKSAPTPGTGFHFAVAHRVGPTFESVRWETREPTVCTLDDMPTQEVDVAEYSTSHSMVITVGRHALNEHDIACTTESGDVVEIDVSAVKPALGTKGIGPMLGSKGPGPAHAPRDTDVAPGPGNAGLVSGQREPAPQVNDLLGFLCCCWGNCADMNSCDLLMFESRCSSGENLCRAKSAGWETDSSAAHPRFREVAEGEGGFEYRGWATACGIL